MAKGDMLMAQSDQFHAALREIMRRMTDADLDELGRRLEAMQHDPDAMTQMIGVAAQLATGDAMIRLAEEMRKRPT